MGCFTYNKMTLEEETPINEPPGWNSNYLYLDIEDMSDYDDNEWWGDDEKDGQYFLSFANGWFYCESPINLSLVFNHFYPLYIGGSDQYPSKCRINKTTPNIVEIVTDEEDFLVKIPGYIDSRVEAGVKILSFNRGVITVPE